MAALTRVEEDPDTAAGIEARKECEGVRMGYTRRQMHKKISEIRDELSELAQELPLEAITRFENVLYVYS